MKANTIDNSQHRQVVSKSLLDKIKTEAAEKAMTSAFWLMLGIPIMALIDKHGWDKKQCQRLDEEVIDYYQEFQHGRITMPEIIELVQSETGIELIDNGRKAVRSGKNDR